MRHIGFCRHSSSGLILVWSNLFRNGLAQFSVIAVIAMLACCNSPAFADDDPGFTEDAKEAIARAVEEDKDIIFLFTGSDWCPPCRALEKNVLSEKDFLFEVSKHYVLVKFDFPKRTPQSEEIALSLIHI